MTSKRCSLCRIGKVLITFLTSVLSDLHHKGVNLIMPYSCFLFVLNLLYHIEQYYTMVHLCTLYHLWVHLIGCIYLCLPLPGKSTLTFLNIFPVFPRSSTPRACIVLQKSPACVSCSLIASNLDISQHLAIYVSIITFLKFFSTTVPLGTPLTFAHF